MAMSGARCSRGRVRGHLPLVGRLLRALHYPASCTGELDERVLAGLDWLIVEAARRGLKLLLVLTNYWDAYGARPA
jgi:hypothetical protein